MAAVGVLDQGCLMVCCQTKNPNLGKFWRVLQWKMLVYFKDTWSIVRSFVIFYRHLVQFVVIWYISSSFGILYQEKSGNPVLDCCELRFFSTFLYFGSTY
jgi:hypothetical protein